ncbi:MAG: acetyl-CoA carboxylase biotin carboxyl carrier protein subunit [Bacteroidaceae bacterium]|nr:acetyl-CoA carboxylase biotin carboxyl carrier protein subunit [Bacteroidaceae bacterium]
MKEYKYIINGKEYAVNIENLQGNQASVTVNGKAYDVEIVGQAPKKITPVAKPAAPAAKPAAAPAAAAGTPAAPAATPGEGTPFKAPLPGTINDIKVAVGQTVNVGDVVLILEAMKMENEITAEKAGTITSITVNKGDSVMEGTTMFTIA